MFFITLVVMTLLCLAFPVTRAYGILGAGLLFYLNFYWTSASFCWEGPPTSTSNTGGNRMDSFEDCIPDALEMVSAWDLPDEDLADAVEDQARLMADISPEDCWEGRPDIM